MCYDTLQLAFRASGVKTPIWDRETTTRHRSTHSLLTREGITLRCYNSENYTAEFSLPRLMSGSNVRLLARTEIAEGLRLAESLISSLFPGGRAVPLSKMRLHRIDAAEDLDLGTPSEVQHRLFRLRTESYHGNLPWIGQDGSINYGRRRQGQRIRFYDKHRECGRAEGVLRVERESRGAILERHLRESGMTLDTDVRESLVSEALYRQSIHPAREILERTSELGSMMPEEVFASLVRTGISETRAHTILGMMDVAKRLGWKNVSSSTRAVYEAKRALKEAGIKLSDLSDLRLPQPGRSTESRPEYGSKTDLDRVLASGLTPERAVQVMGALAILREEGMDGLRELHPRTRNNLLRDLARTGLDWRPPGA